MNENSLLDIKGVAFKMAKNKYFGNGIDPSCSYCVFGNRSREGNKVLCEKQGLVDVDNSTSREKFLPTTNFKLDK